MSAATVLPWRLPLHTNEGENVRNKGRTLGPFFEKKGPKTSKKLLNWGFFMCSP